MKLLQLIILVLFSCVSAAAEPSVYVLPVQGELPFLSQIPGTNVFVGPGASSIFKGKITINGKQYNKIPEPPLTPPEWADGLKARLERAMQSRKDYKVVSKKSDANYLVRAILTRFGKQEGQEDVGVTFETALLNGKTEEAISLFTASSSGFQPRAEPEDLSWKEFVESEPNSAVAMALKAAALDLASQLAGKLSSEPKRR